MHFGSVRAGPSGHLAASFLNLGYCLQDALSISGQTKLRRLQGQEPSCFKQDLPNPNLSPPRHHRHALAFSMPRPDCP